MTENQPYLQFNHADESSPILLAFHGIGASEHDLVPAFQSFQSIATIVHPRGPLQSNFGYAWYQLRQIGVPDPTTFGKALETVDRWVEFAQKEHGKKPEQIYLTGFSQGTILSLSYALLNPDKVRGVLGFSGYIPKQVVETAKDTVAQRPLRIFLTHGEADQMFPVSTLFDTKAQLQELGYAVHAETHEGGHEILSSAIESAKQWFESEL